jgi:hypothetical protein
MERQKSIRIGSLKIKNPQKIERVPNLKKWGLF